MHGLKFDTAHNPFPGPKPVHAKNGMVATSEPQAAGAGLEILKLGGNAVDAAVATAAALTVVEPTSNGIGSDAFAIVWMKGELYGLNASGLAPRHLLAADILAQGHKEMPTFGWLPVTVPGTPSAWAALIKRFGNLTLAECLAPAIRLAEEGFRVSPFIAQAWSELTKLYEKAQSDHDLDEWFKTFTINGQTPTAGQRFKMPHHAHTLKEIGETQAESFYKGSLAKKIIESSKGQFSAEDLARYEPEWVRPISTNYRGFEVHTIPPNSQGITALKTLNILSGFDLKNRDCLNTYHVQFEAMKHGMQMGKQTIADPRFSNVDLDQFLNPSHARDIGAQIKQNTKASCPTDAPQTGGTVYLATADKDGNMVSYIQSNYLSFGSGIVVPGTGIALHNRGAAFSLNEGDANVLEGGKRPYHTLMPGFLVKDGQAVGPYGVMGAFMQPQGHVQVLTNLIDFGLNPQAALNAPRWQWLEGKKVAVEKDFDQEIVEVLKARGHEIAVEEKPTEFGFGRGQMILRDPITGELIGATEKRCDGYVAFY